MADNIEKARALVDYLRSTNLTCATAESCTGGGIGSAITAVAGASDVFAGGAITYLNRVKHAILGVGKDVLERCGAVSKECACEMAKGARERFEVDLAVSVTGLAGPGGDGVHEAGFVWFGVSSRRGECAQSCQFAGNREDVRRQAVAQALDLLIAEANEVYKLGQIKE